MIAAPLAHSLTEKAGSGGVETSKFRKSRRSKDDQGRRDEF